MTAYVTTEELARRAFHTFRVPREEWNFFRTVFEFVREEELAGRDTYALWQHYRADVHADLATVAYLAALASTRKPERPRDWS